jgi:hypothetical protein
MPNNNISPQNQENQSDVFVYYTEQDIEDLKKVCDDYSKVLDKTIEAQRDYERAIEEIAKTRKTWFCEWMKNNSSGVKTFSLNEYQRTMEDIEEKCMAWVREEVKKDHSAKSSLMDDYRPEDNEMWNLMLTVFEKERRAGC